MRNRRREPGRAVKSSSGHGQNVNVVVVGGIGNLAR